MSNKIKLKITGQIPLGGKRPQETFSLESGEDGLPLSRYWRKRLEEERKTKFGAIAIVKEKASVPITNPISPPPLPAPTIDVKNEVEAKEDPIPESIKPSTNQPNKPKGVK